MARLPRYVVYSLDDAWLDACSAEEAAARVGCTVGEATQFFDERCGILNAARDQERAAVAALLASVPGLPCIC